MYVIPDGEVRLIKNCPITKMNEQIYFSNSEEQERYFLGLSTKSNLIINKVTFIKDVPGVIRVPFNVSTLYNVNYMMFQNSGFSSKWFYAMVTRVEYTGNNVSTIYFIIDDMQTWFMQTQLRPETKLRECFVEREHSTTDIIGDNLIEENLATGDKVYNNFQYRSGDDIITSSHYDFNITKANRIMIVSAVNFADITIETTPSSWVSNILEKFGKINSDNPFEGIKFVCGKVDRSYKYNNYISGARYFVLLEEGDEIPIKDSEGQIESTYVVTKQDVNLAKAIIGSIIEIGHSDGILGVFSIPATGLVWEAIERSSTLFNGWDEFIGNVFWEDGFPKTIGLGYLSEKNPIYTAHGTQNIFINTLDGYTPRNKKLYNFPYTQFNITNYCGNELILRPEMLIKSSGIAYDGDINGHGIRFKYRIMNTLQLPASTKLIVEQYKGGDDLYENCVDIGPYPVHSWRSGVFERWIAQNRAQLFAGGISTMMNIGSNVGTIGMQDRQAYYTQETKGPYGEFIITQGDKKFGPTKTDLNFAGSTIANVATNTWNQLAGVASASNQPEKINGSVGGSNVLYDNGKQMASLRLITINIEYAKVIDDYFTKYGYACKQIKVPNISSRPRWNYVKTSGCIIQGDMPSDVNETLCELFDSGITFWRYREDMNIGDYSEDNSPET